MKRNLEPLCGFLQEATDMNGRVSATAELLATLNVSSIAFKYLPFHQSSINIHMPVYLILKYSDFYSIDAAFGGVTMRLHKKIS